MFKDGYLIPNLDAIPDEMKAYRQWVFWKAFKEADDKKARKIPMLRHKPAKSNDPRMWLPWEMMQHWEKFGMNGIEFMLHEKLDPFSMIDLDSVASDFLLSEFAQKTVDYFDSYAEFSPSGKGVRIIVRGKLKESLKHPKKNENILPVEIYSHARPTSMTGVLCYEHSISEAQTKLQKIFDKYKTIGNIEQYFNGREKINDVFTLPKETAPEGMRNNFLCTWAGIILNKINRDEGLYWQHLNEVNQCCCIPPVDNRRLKALGRGMWKKHFGY